MIHEEETIRRRSYWENRPTLPFSRTPLPAVPTRSCLAQRAWCTIALRCARGDRGDAAAVSATGHSLGCPLFSPPDAPALRPHCSRRTAHIMSALFCAPCAASQCGTSRPRLREERCRVDAPVRSSRNRRAARASRPLVVEASSANSVQRVAIVGGGVAGLTLAHALKCVGLVPYPLPTLPRTALPSWRV